MSGLAELPLWAAWAIVVLSLFGAGLSLLGAIGLVRLKQFYQRAHAPTLGTTMGMICIVAASVIFWSFALGYLAVKDLLIGLFLTVTTPVTLILLARASAYRDRIEGDKIVPLETDA
jgi:multicomponent K+:H+ antiporter subunit G